MPALPLRPGPAERTSQREAWPSRRLTACAQDSVTVATASLRSTSRSDDGQTILGAKLTARSKPTTCTFGRDGGIRTRALLLPNQLQPVAGHRLVSPGMAFTWDDVG
jgi:hypothetical protein